MYVSMNRFSRIEKSDCTTAAIQFYETAQKISDVFNQLHIMVSIDQSAEWWQALHETISESSERQEPHMYELYDSLLEWMTQYLPAGEKVEANPTLLQQVEAELLREPTEQPNWQTAEHVSKDYPPPVYCPQCSRVISFYEKICGGCGILLDTHQ